MKHLVLAVRTSLALFLCGVIALHFLPGPLLQTTQGVQLSYDPRFNFLSEYARTQYAPLMEVNFICLAVTAASLARALWLTGLRREGWFLVGAGLFLVLLACFRTDLVDLRTDALTCGDPLRVEPCTSVGRVHNPLSTVVFGFVAAAAVSLLARRVPRWRSIAWAAVACALLGLILVGLSLLYLRSIGYTARLWVGLMQRALVVPALLWLWALTTRLTAP